jgi:hypothetical protein
MVKFSHDPRVCFARSYKSIVKAGSKYYWRVFNRDIERNGKWKIDEMENEKLTKWKMENYEMENGKLRNGIWNIGHFCTYRLALDLVHNDPTSPYRQFSDVCAQQFRIFPSRDPIRTGWGRGCDLAPSPPPPPTKCKSTEFMPTGRDR